MSIASQSAQLRDVNEAVSVLAGMGADEDTDPDLQQMVALLCNWSSPGTGQILTCRSDLAMPLEGRETARDLEAELARLRQDYTVLAHAYADSRRETARLMRLLGLNALVPPPA